MDSNSMKLHRRGLNPPWNLNWYGEKLGPVPKIEAVWEKYLNMEKLVRKIKMHYASPFFGTQSTTSRR